MKIAESNNFTRSSAKSDTTTTSSNTSQKTKELRTTKTTTETTPVGVVNVPSSIQINKSGVTIPIMCSATNSSVKLDEISKVVMEKDEDSCFYDIFVSSSSYPCANGDFDKSKAIEHYQKQQLPISHLGIVEEKLDNGVLSFESDDNTKQYLDEFMCSCKIDYGALRELFISMSSK